jgi:hypothetical protein
MTIIGATAAAAAAANALAAAAKARALKECTLAFVAALLAGAVATEVSVYVRRRLLPMLRDTEEAVYTVMRERAYAKVRRRRGEAQEKSEEEEQLHARAVAEAMVKARHAWDSKPVVDYASMLTQIYQKHNPEKLEDPEFVKNTLARYVGREKELVAALKKRYNAGRLAVTQLVEDDFVVATQAGPTVDYASMLAKIYQKHNPEKLEDPDFVKNTLARYGGREKELVAALKKKYAIAARARFDAQ